MKIAYGHQIESDDDEYIKLTENVSLAHVDAGDLPLDYRELHPWWMYGLVATGRCRYTASIEACYPAKCSSPRYLRNHGEA